jgi:hypothetical protein
LAFKPEEIAANFCSMNEKTSRARALSKKDFQARVDQMIADEERTFGQLVELRDRVNAIVAELDQTHDTVAALPSISKIIATPSRFPWRFPPRPPHPDSRSY